MRSSLHTTLLVGLAGVLSMATACGDDTTATTSGLGGAGGSGDGGSDSTTSQGPGPGSTSTATTGQSTATATSSQSGTSSVSSTSSGEGGNPSGGGEGGIGQGGNPSGGGEGGIGQGGNPSGGGEGGIGTSSVASTSVASTATASVVSSSSGGNNCTAIAAGDFEVITLAGAAVYGTTFTPNLDLADVDDLRVEFYGPPDFDGDDTGTFDLSAAGDDNYATCSRCVLVVVDGGDKFFFQSEGTLTIDAASDQMNGVIDATLTNATLVEVTIAGDATSTPVPNGECLTIASADLVVEAPPCAGFLCDDGECLPEADWECDAFLDCADGSDEGPTNATCECALECDVVADGVAGEICIPDALVCDGVPADCVGGEDEASCVADPFTLDSGTVNVAIPDNSAVGACVPMTFATAGTIATIDTVTVSLNHSFAGDITLELRSPDAVNFFAVLVDQPGGSGASANYASASAVTFSESAVRTAESIGQGLTTNQIVCAQDGVCTFIPEESFATFLAGAPANGTWNLCGFDGFGQDVGNFVRIQVSGTLQ